MSPPPDNPPPPESASTEAPSPSATPVARPVATPASVAPPPAPSLPASEPPLARDPQPASPPAPTTTAEAHADDPAEQPASADAVVSNRFTIQAPSWLSSLVLHLAVLLLLAIWPWIEIPEVPENLLLFEPSNSEEQLDDFADLTLDDLDIEIEPVDFEEQPDTDVIADVISFSPFNEATAAPRFVELSESTLGVSALSNPSDLQGFDGEGTTGRGAMARTEMARRGGGSKASEESVASALKWLADHQNPDGTWSLIHDRHRCRGRCDHTGRVPGQGDPYTRSLSSGTGLALLPFLGAGQTHKQGRHRKTVAKGLAALVELGKQQEVGASWTDSGSFYAHGIAAIALTEAYGMTKDASLRAPAQAAVDYITYAQSPRDGGWRYRARPPTGDTSVTGWQVMALKSAYLSDLSVNPATIQWASSFLDRAQSQNGARYSYLPRGANGQINKPGVTVTSVGLLCRMYLGWKQDNKALQEGVAFLAKEGPSESDFYYNYYASQVIFQHTGGQGKTWREWNRKLRDQIIAQQSTRGHTKGSWFVEGRHNDRGGRIYMTSLATMTLEVYYRYMPIYQQEAIDRDFAN